MLLEPHGEVRKHELLISQQSLRLILPSGHFSFDALIDSAPREEQQSRKLPTMKHYMMIALPCELAAAPEQLAHPATPHLWTLERSASRTLRLRWPINVCLAAARESKSSHVSLR